MARMRVSISIVVGLVVGAVGCDFQQQFSDARPDETIWDFEISCTNYCGRADVAAGPGGDVYLVVPFHGNLRVGTTTFDPAVCRPEEDDSDTEWGVGLLRLSGADGAPVWSRMLCADGGVELQDPVLGFDAAGDLLVAGMDPYVSHDFAIRSFAASDGAPNWTHTYPRECPLDSTDAEPRLLAAEDGFAMLRCGEVGFYDAVGDPSASHEVFTAGQGAATDFAVVDATAVLVAGQFHGSAAVGGDWLPNVSAQFAARYTFGELEHVWSARVADSLEYGDGPRLVADPAGNLLMAGMSNQPARELLVTRIEADGTAGWARRFSGSSPVVADDAVWRSNGRFTVAGWFDGQVDFDGEVLAFTDDIIQPQGIFVVDLDPTDGGVMRASRFGGYPGRARLAAGPGGVLYFAAGGYDGGLVSALAP